MAKRDYYRYELRQGHEVVYVGTTDDPNRRETEHRGDKNFGNLSVVGPAVTEESARKWESDRVETYRNNHGGRNPKYNK